MVDEQTRRDMLDNDLARADRIAKQAFGKDARASLHPTLGIVVSSGIRNCALTSRDFERSDDELSQFISDKLQALAQDPHPKDAFVEGQKIAMVGCSCHFCQQEALDRLDLDGRNRRLFDRLG